MIQGSPTLNLVNDFFRFVTGFFEVISKSAPHIYHSALPLSPQTSLVQKLYKSYSSPLTRIVQGLPTSWNPSIVTKKTPSQIRAVTWSPCSRFIAIAWENFLEVLDAITFEQHISFNTSGQHIGHKPSVESLTFSPDSHLLTYVENNPVKLVSLDLQTGVSVSAISLELEECTMYLEEYTPELEEHIPKSLTYSPCGTIVGVLSLSAGISTICTYNILSGTCLSSHSVGHVYGEIWTYGGYLQFATFEPGTATIWEVGFISEHPAMGVKSLPTPNNFDPSKEYLFLPTLSWLIYIYEDTVSVWDAQHSKLLLDAVDIKIPCKMTSTFNGHFFACAVGFGEIYLWKESSTGYILHQKFMSSDMFFSFPKPFLSPDGESIVVSTDSTLQLWHTIDSITSPSSIPTQIFHSENPFIVEFSPDKPLAVAVRLGGNTATVLDLESGTPQLTIDTGMRIYGLKIAGNSIIAIGNGKIVTWNLPEGSHILNTRVNINDSVQTRTFDCPFLSGGPFRTSASISPDLKYIAIVGQAETPLEIYDTYSGKFLADALSVGDRSWFSPDGQEVWCYTFFGAVEGWMIIKSDLLEQTELLPTQHQPEGCPWKSSYGYEVTYDGWILSSSGKQLLWLPPHWQSRERCWETYRGWSGQFLALLDPDLPEIVILECLEE